MSTIYDKRKGKSGGITNNHSIPSTKVQTTPVPQAAVRPAEDTSTVSIQNKEPSDPQESNFLRQYENVASQALALVDDVVLKNYLTKLSEMDVVQFEGDTSMSDTILFKVNKMVYEKDEYATDKFISIISAMTYTIGSLFMIINGHKDHTDFYFGIKCDDPDRNVGSVAETFKNAIKGQFPGAEIDDTISMIKPGEERSAQQHLVHKISEATTISMCSGIPAQKNSKGEYTNATFIQGIEKFATAMQGKEYTAIVLASNLAQQEITNVRAGYENIYTQLSAMATQQVAYSTNESLANAISRTRGYSDSESLTITDGTSTTYTKTHTTNSSHTTQKGESQENGCGKASKIVSAFSAPLMSIGAILTATGVGAPLGVGMMAAGAAGSVGGAVLGAGAKQLNKSESDTNGVSDSESTAEGETHSEATGQSHTETFSETNGETSTIGSSKNFTLTIQNKHIQEILKRLDKQLERIAVCESTGLWSTSAYFLSYDNDRYIAETGATIFRSIMQGEQSGVELSAINTWYSNNPNYKALRSNICSLTHPSFTYTNPLTNSPIILTPTNMLSSKEVAIVMGLPRKSVPGFPVIEHCSLGKDVVRLSQQDNAASFELGCIFDQGVEYSNNKVNLNAKSMTQHTFVTGSTGCGKSNTIYYLLKQIRNQANAPKFLIIEPAKGEYKDVFGNEHIYGTNPLKTPLLKINPFKFPEGVHVLEHIDRLIEIFNVCWPMYAAMPAVLKEAILNSYEDCGWDLYKSRNKYSDNLFPTFADLLNELILVINNSAYSEEVKSNYQGSLVTRVKSLTNGVSQHIFSENELGDQALFDENVIIDLSRIGSQETKSLIMGILIMRLNEYRSNSDIPHNSLLRHITVLEEAHNILKRCSQEQSPEGSNVAGKSVEMISNAIAEMRTYGEGFIIVDQSPGAVDVSAIRNTNTKIIMRLPDDNDRRVAGKASGMKDSQVDEIAKLPTGVAVVYQNDWEDPVLCKIGKFTDKEIHFNFFPEENESESEEDTSIVKAEVLKLLLKGRVDCRIDVDIEQIETSLFKTNLSTFNKTSIYEIIEEYKTRKDLQIWKDNHFASLSRLVTEILSVKSEVARLADTVGSFDELTMKLVNLIHETNRLMPESLDLVICQCFMKDYSLGGEVRKKIYSAWYQSVRNKQ